MDNVKRYKPYMLNYFTQYHQPYLTVFSTICGKWKGMKRVIEFRGVKQLYNIYVLFRIWYFDFLLPNHW